MKQSETRKAIVIALAGVVGLLVGGAMGGLFVRELAPLPIIGGFAVFLLCGRRALQALDVDEMVFVHRKASDVGQSDGAPLLTAGAALGQGANLRSPSAEPSPRGKASGKREPLAFRRYPGDPFGSGWKSF